MSLNLCQIVGHKNSGKTTLMMALIEKLNAKGRRVATLKHHGHFEDDPLLKGDSGKHFQAGARVASIVAPGYTHFSYIDEPPLEAYLEFYKRISAIDWLLIEGFKQALLPKIVLIRNESDWLALKNLSNIKAVVTDLPDVVTEIKNQRFRHFYYTETERLAAYLFDHEATWSE